jgi:hypothetical protein
MGNFTDNSEFVLVVLAIRVVAFDDFFKGELVELLLVSSSVTLISPRPSSAVGMAGAGVCVPQAARNSASNDTSRPLLNLICCPP